MVAHRPSLLLGMVVVFGTGHGARCDDDRDGAANFSGSLVFATDRSIESVIDIAQRELASGETASGLTRLQRLLDGESKSLVRMGSAHVGVPDAVNHILRELRGSERSKYQELFDGQASSELESALTRGDPVAVARMTDRFRHTSAGARAAALLAVLAYDRGDPEAAESWLAMIRGDHQEAVGAARLDGLSARLDRLRPLTDSSHESAATSQLTWNADFGVAPAARSAIAVALAEIDLQGVMPILTSRPVVVQGRIITSTVSGLHCLDAETGDRLWSIDDESHAARLSRHPGRLDSGLRIAQVEALMLRRLIRDSLHHHLSFDERRVYRIVPNEESTEQRELQAVDIKTGAIVWQIGSRHARPAGRVSGRRDDGPESCMGPPLVDDTQLLILAQRDNQVDLLELEPSDGSEQWRLPLGRAVRSLKEDRERLSTACRLSRQGNRVYCPTAAGALVCVDTSRRRVIWAFRHPRNDLPETSIREGDGSQHREMPTRGRWPAAEVWVHEDRCIYAAPETDRLYGLETSAGQVVWSRPRGDAMQVLMSGDELLIVGQSGITALNPRDGSTLNVVPTPRPMGRGVIVAGEVVLPVGEDEIYRVALPISSANATASPGSAPNIRVVSHPAAQQVSLTPRNLSVHGGALLSQSATTIGRLPVENTGTDSELTASLQFSDSLHELARIHARLRPSMILLSKVNLPVGLLDLTVTRFSESLGVTESVTDRATALVKALMQSDLPVEESRMEGALRRLVPEQLYVHHDDEHWVCRLDRWLEGRASHVSPLPFEEANVGDAVKTATAAQAVRWPSHRPTISERETSFALSSHNNKTYLVRVPMIVGPDSPWSDVTVDVDRQGKFVYFHDAAHPQPGIVALPREIGADRSAMKYLRAWAPADVLVLRIGTELVAFRRSAGDPLPTGIHWPGAEESYQLLGPRRSSLVFREATPEESPAWNDSTSGYIDAFGRTVGEVGPVRADYLCLHRRSYIIALDTRTGRELWRRSHRPVGTHSIGDDEFVILFQKDADRVTVLSAFDGRRIAEWDILNVRPPKQNSGVRPVLVLGRTAVFRYPADRGQDVVAVDMSNGKRRWNLNVDDKAHLLSVGDDSTMVVVEQNSESAPAEVRFVDTESGAADSEHTLVSPRQLRTAFVVPDGDQLFIVLSGKVTDRSVLGAQQIRGGLGREPVNGSLHAVDLPTRKILWSRPLENVEFPLHQPRHVPLLILNDVIQPATANSPQGRLLCLDKRTGETLFSLTHSMHVYYAIESSFSAGVVELRLPRRTVRFDYGPDVSQSSPSDP